MNAFEWQVGLIGKKGVIRIINHEHPNRVSLSNFYFLLRELLFSVMHGN